MAMPSASRNDNLLRRHLNPATKPELADALRKNIAALRPHLLDLVQFGESLSSRARTLGQWRRTSELSALLTTYSNHIYRHEPARPRENKPLISLWAQWYIGLLVPPLMLSLLTQPLALNLCPDRFQVEFHETGRAARFWIDTQSDAALTALPPALRMEQLLVQAIAPVVTALEATGDINGKLIWSNTGYLINWHLGEMKSLLGSERVEELRQRLFFSQYLADGQSNPLWRSVVLRDGVLTRRTCCQRYRLPGVQQCGDCTLK